MFAKIHKNLYTDKVAIFISKTTFYRWLNGMSPNLWHIAALDESLQTNTTIAYARIFTSTALQLSKTSSLQTVKEIVAKAKLDEEDKTLLAEHHKKRIWRDQKTLLDYSE